MRSERPSEAKVYGILLDIERNMYSILNAVRDNHKFLNRMIAI